jgi:sulfoxide reductase heme-binding subunit YedZ
MPRNVADSWMTHEFTFMLRRQKVALWVLGLPALTPLFFMLPAVVTGNERTMDIAVADVLGTGGEALLFLTLLVTPMVTLTSQRWFVPLRKWYGIMFAITVIADAIIASITTGFAGGVFGRLAGHSFLLAGFTMVLLAVPLLAISNNWSQRWLGKYWKPIQRTTYVIWGLLFVHLALLFGFKVSTEPGDGDPVFHNRLYQYAACSILLLVLRLPPVRHWVSAQQKAGRQRAVYLTFLPLVALFVLGFSFIVNEEIFKGVDAFNLHPSTE